MFTKILSFILMSVYANFISASSDTSMNKDNTAIIVVDVQKDFTQEYSGALAVNGTNFAYVNSVILETAKLKEAGFHIVVTQDYHPHDHSSFKAQGGAWPPHCIQGTPGADLLVTSNDYISQKGTEQAVDSYSAFIDDAGKKWPLEDHLKRRGVTNLIIYGIATDYCVRATALDAKKFGFDVTVVGSLSRGVDSSTCAKAITDFAAAGIRYVDNLSELPL